MRLDGCSQYDQVHICKSVSSLARTEQKQGGAAYDRLGNSIQQLATVKFHIDKQSTYGGGMAWQTIIITQYVGRIKSVNSFNLILEGLLKHYPLNSQSPYRVARYKKTLIIM